MDTTLVKALREALQRGTGARVEVVETHISWVLLTATFAYKLKKPVHLPFVDFASIAARRHFCEEELRLNRRFAPSLYLDVVPVCGAPEAPRLGGDGVPIDHVVRMRRFPESSLLRNLLVAGRLEPAWLDGFAQRLAALQEAAERMGPPSACGAPDVIVRAALDVVRQLLAQRSDGRLALLSTWIQDQSQALHMAWIERQQGGAVRECHGDLHMANMVLVDGELTAFDCIEFDPMMRRIDVMSDIAFLTMDLRAHGRADLAFRFLDAWLQHSGDYAGAQVLRFYEVYRALVRAMAAGLGPQVATASAGTSKPDYLACAAQLAQDPRGRARLLITHGFSGSGKSALASQLLCAAGAVRVRSDVERKRLFGLAPLASSAAQGLAIYGEQATRRTFERLRACAHGALLAGYPVIVDAAFLRRAERRSFQVLAAELGVPFAILDCRAAEAVLRRRVAQRGASGADASEANLGVLERQLAAHEPLEADERALALAVFTDDAVDIASLEARWRAKT
ncbi:AAA family ATPase [Variovorax sp. EBFNA2]|uniref:bifunctional aminoglycoside phosphotransferase/ATP-binding protein n=1 Tax=Variovorax sp. EBFNA2 TaxID=3342097 RepID=UPI0029C0C7FE|nr:AAA family ATPase [Variovorax boronicumulans]WPG40908.1 AAA family ATPase [Variovorax boronicumulans]